MVQSVTDDAVSDFLKLQGATPFGTDNLQDHFGINYSKAVNLKARLLIERRVLCVSMSAALVTHLDAEH